MLILDSSELDSSEVSMSMTLKLKQAAILGEGLLWHAPTKRWWWTDIEASTVHAWAADAEPVLSVKLPDRMGSMAHCRSGRLLLGLAKRLCFIQLPSATDVSGQRQLQIQSPVAVDTAESRTRINDGRTDRRGFFVFGTINEANEKRPIASFYQYSVQYGLRRLALPAVAIANSICFSLDGKTMYFTDTITRRIQQCDYDAETARVANVRLFAEVSDEGANPAYPDGSVIDRYGCLWNAQWGAGRIVQYSPKGEEMRKVLVPTKNPTCPAFGGENLDQLMVTSSRQDMSPKELLDMPHAGSLFGVKLPEPTGIRDTLFDDVI